jgi:hypothetical protein
LKNKCESKTKCPSPDGNENPFTFSLKVKDCNVQQEIAPEKLKKQNHEND